MGTLWRRLKDALSTDDLFWRVSCVLFALFLAGVGALVCYLLLGPDRASIWWLWQGLLWIVAGGLYLWAAVLIVGCFSPPGTRPFRWGRHAMPRAVDYDGEMSLTVMVILLPAAVLTIALRCIGVRGSKSSRGRSAWLLR
jgi:hypothetical protein